MLTSRGFVAGRGHREIADAAIAGGATAVQLRAPELGDGTLTELAIEFKERGPDAGGEAYSLVVVVHPDLNP